MRDLTQQQRNALAEIGNIGASHAATALSESLRTSVSFSVTSVKCMVPQDATIDWGGFTNPVSALVCLLQGGSGGYVVLLFSPPMAMRLAHTLTGTEHGPGQNANLAATVAMQKIADNTLQAYMAALAKMLRLKFSCSPSYLHADAAEVVLDKILTSLGISTDKFFLIQTTLEAEKEQITGDVLLIPDAEGLDNLLKALF